MTNPSTPQRSSIQARIIGVAGACILAVVLALTGTAVVMSFQTNDQVSGKISQAMISETSGRLLNRATTEARTIESRLRVGIDAARNMANTFEVLASESEGAVPPAMRRQMVNDVLRHTLLENPAINGTYSAWEPDAIDGDDASFRDRADTGADATGRLLPYWTRNGSGGAVVEPLAGHEDTAPGSNGRQSGAWYLIPRDANREIIIAPLTYEADGRIETLSTFAIPVMVNGQFRGIAGANFKLNFIQQLAEEVSESIFDGAASVMIVSENGYIIAASEDASLAGSTLTDVEDRFSDQFSGALDGTPMVLNDAEHPNIEVLAPVLLSTDVAPWTFVISVPRQVALATVQGIETDLNTSTTNSAFWLAGVGVAILILSGGVLAWSVGGVSRPIKEITQSMKRLADGDTTSAIPHKNRSDEVGQMAMAVEGFRVDLGRMAEMQEERKAADARHEAERVAMIDRMRESFGASAQAAARGDFSFRVDAKFSEEALRQIATDFNAVLGTVETGLAETNRVMALIADGDIAARMSGNFSGAFSDLMTNVNNSMDRLDTLISELSIDAASMQQISGKMQGGAEDLAGRAEEQASALEETAATMEEMTATVRANAESAEQAREHSGEAADFARRGGDVVQEAVSAMARIEESSAKISDIISVIDSIAFQTNLLALNAAVEAARAGDAGKGFAVVASEVRTLAQRSADAAKDITALILESSEHVTSGSDLVRRTGESLTQIVSAVEKVAGTVSDISRANREQSAGVDEISNTVSHLDQMTQKNAVLAQQSTGSARDMVERSQRLSDQVGFFRTSATPSPGQNHRRAS